MIKAASKITVFIIILLASAGLRAQGKEDAALQLPEATTLNNLTFGQVVTGTSGEILITDPNAAKFYLKNGVPGEYVIKLVLPQYITNGKSNIPVKFDVTHAAWSYNDNPGTSTTFDPHQDLIVNPSNPGTKIYIWIGGAISPGVQVSGGPYTGNITLSITKK
jgi:hypothetical protein